MPKQNEETKEGYTLSMIVLVVSLLSMGAGSTLTAIAYAHGTFLTKDVADERMASRKEDFKDLKDDFKALTREVKDQNKWLRDNWHKRNPE